MNDIRKERYTLKYRSFLISIHSAAVHYLAVRLLPLTGIILSKLYEYLAFHVYRGIL